MANRIRRRGRRSGKSRRTRRKSRVKRTKRRSSRRTRRRSRRRRQRGGRCPLSTATEINTQPEPQEETTNAETAKAQTGGKCKKSKAQKGGKKRKLNAFIVAKEKARKGGAESFVYNNKTYHKKKLKTGMVVYSSK